MELAFVEAASRIKSEFERAFPEQAHLGHASVGTWLFYWTSGDLRSTLDLLRDEDSDALRKSANDFLEAGFGEHRGPTLNAPAPEQVPAAFA